MAAVPPAARNLFLVFLAVLVTLLLSGAVQAQDSPAPAGVLPAQPAEQATLLTGIKSISAGGYHNCAITVEGGVLCWLVGTWPLQEVAAAGEDVQAVAVGAEINGYHACLLTGSGAVKCWGSNASGQLGDGTTIDRTDPVAVTGLDAGVQAISAGWDYTCALTAAGGVKCWGNNDHDQLGDGTSGSSRLTPVDVVGLSSGVKALAAGGFHTCAVLATGSVKCWGENRLRQLGPDFVGDFALVPVDLPTLGNDFQTISAGGYHTCGLTAAGAKCWGYNDEYQLGWSSLEPDPQFYVTGLASGVQAIVAGNSHTCALVTGGVVQCWGSNSNGQLGDGTRGTKRFGPMNVEGLAGGVQGIAAGYGHTCAVTASGGVKCWGGHSTEFLAGDVITSTWRSDPTEVIGLGSGVQAIALGGAYYSYGMRTCALLADGSVACWGQGGLGDGRAGIYSFTPVKVVGLAGGAQAIAAGAEETCALTTSGDIQCWGNERGRLTPVSISGSITGVKDIAMGGSSGLALTDDGAVWQWDGGSAPSPVPSLGSGVQAISAGSDHACVLMAGGGVKCWGGNRYGQVGNGTTSPQSDPLIATPVNVVGLQSGVRAVDAGMYNTCAVMEGGGVKCWGLYGPRTAHGNPICHSTAPNDVPGLESDIQAVEADDGATWALTAAGGVLYAEWPEVTIWPYVDCTIRPAPVRVAGLESGVQAIRARNSNRCVIVEGRVKCWGPNEWGQLGIGVQWEPADVWVVPPHKIALPIIRQ